MLREKRGSGFSNTPPNFPHFTPGCSHDGLICTPPPPNLDRAGAQGMLPRALNLHTLLCLHPLEHLPPAIPEGGNVRVGSQDLARQFQHGFIQLPSLALRQTAQVRGQRGPMLQGNCADLYFVYFCFEATSGSA